MSVFLHLILTILTQFYLIISITISPAWKLENDHDTKKNKKKCDLCLWFGIFMINDLNYVPKFNT